MERVGVVTYRLKLPDEAKIQSVFHVVLLKPYRGSSDGIVQPLPPEFEENRPKLQSLAICSSRMVLVGGKLERQVLVQWVGLPLEDAS